MSEDNISLIILFRPALKALKDLTQASVFGLVWFKAGKGKGTCSATPQTLGTVLEVNEKTVRRHLKKLCDLGYLVDTTPPEKIRSKVHDYQVTAAGLALTVTESATDEQPEPAPTDILTDNLSLRAIDEAKDSGQSDPNEDANKGQIVPSHSHKGQSDRNKGQNVQQKELNKSLPESSKPLEPRLPLRRNAREKPTPGGVVIDQEFGDVCKLLTDNKIDISTPVMADMVKEVYDDCRPPDGESRLSWFTYGLREAYSIQDARSPNRIPPFKLIRKIIVNVSEAGSLEQHEANRNGAKTNGRTNGTGQHQTAPTSQQTAEYIEQNDAAWNAAYERLRR